MTKDLIDEPQMAGKMARGGPQYPVNWGAAKFSESICGNSYTDDSLFILRHVYGVYPITSEQSYATNP
jgi:hypothetical protein